MEKREAVKLLLEDYALRTSVVQRALHRYCTDYTEAIDRRWGLFSNHRIGTYHNGIPELPQVPDLINRHGQNYLIASAISNMRQSNNRFTQFSAPMIVRHIQNLIGSTIPGTALESGNAVLVTPEHLNIVREFFLANNAIGINHIEE